MKRIFFVVGITLISCVGFIAVSGYNIIRSGQAVAGNIISGTPDEVKQSLNSLEYWWRPVHRLARLVPSRELRAVDELVTGLPELIGVSGARHYVLLLQNNMELRPTGGFMGSYAEVWFRKGKLDNLLVQDIYVPDGQIKGYVKEPEAIRKYLFNDNHPGWRLRDANWHPDFPEATKAIDWFFTEGGLEPVDGYVAITLHPIIDILGVTGGITVPDYNITVASNTFYQEAQRQAELNFFPGSTQKGDFLRHVGDALVNRLLSNPHLLPKLVPIMYQEISEKQVAVAIPDILGSDWHAAGWDGGLTDTASDYLMINEANLGMTKANCCIDRKLTGSITVSNQTVEHRLDLTYLNSNPPKPTPPEQWGGGYKNYLRIIVPLAAELTSIEVNNQPVAPADIDTETFGSKKSFGFLNLTEGGQRSLITIRYTVPQAAVSRPYSLLFQKQAGIDFWPVSIEIENQGRRSLFAGQLRSDRMIR